MVWPATCATGRRAPGSCTTADCVVPDVRLGKASPLDLEAVRGRILLDEERGTAEARRDRLEDPRRDLEPLPSVVEPHEVLRHPVFGGQLPHERFEVGSFQDPLDQRPVVRHDLPRPRDVLRPPFDTRSELPSVLVPARAIVDRRRPLASEDPQGDGVGPLHAVREFVLISYPWTFIRGKFASENSISFRFTKARPSAPAHSIKRTRSASRSGIK